MTTKTTASKAATLIIGTEAIRAEFKLIAAAGKKLDTRIQVAGLSVLHHINEHGDVTVATQLVNELFGSLSKGHRKQAMVDWLVKFGKVKLNKDVASKKAQPFLYDKHTVTDMQGATDMPWYDCKPDNEIVDLDVVKLLAALVKKATKDGAKIVEGQEDLVAKLAALVPVTK